MKLSEHFSLFEMTKSQIAIRRGVPNQPNAQVITHLQAVCENILEPVRAHYQTPFSPSSAYRSEMLNRLMGSHNRSQHIRGEAVDFEVPNVSTLELAHWIKDHLEFDQLILEYFDPERPRSGWVHCSYVEGKNRGRILTIGMGSIKQGLPERGA